MTKTVPDRALTALLSFEDEKDNKVSAEGALPTLNQDKQAVLDTDTFLGLLRAWTVSVTLPTLNERVELFLRAEYGEGLMFTASERAAARARILSALEDNSAGEVHAPVRADLPDREAEVRGMERQPSTIAEWTSFPPVGLSHGSAGQGQRGSPAEKGNDDGKGRGGARKGH
jgi:hypothetical protein